MRINYKFRKKSHFLFALVFVVFFGCDKNSTSGENSAEEFADQSAEAAAYSSFYMENTTTVSSALTNVISLSKTGDDTLFTGCPLAVYNYLLRELTLDYGSGCESRNETYHSGSITLNGSIENGKLMFSTLFNDFTSNSFTVDGAIEFEVSADSIKIQIVNGILTRNDTTVTIDAELVLKADLNGTLSDPSDDSYTIAGYGTVTAPNTGTFTFTISSPLIYKASCKFPVSGVMTISKDKEEADVDFSPENNQCDDIVTVTVGSYEKTFSLSTLF